MNGYQETEKKDTYDTLLNFIEMNNIAVEADIEESRLIEIARNVISGYKEDKNSRTEWEEKIEKSMKLAKQVVEAKSTPWENAANVKYPLMTNSAIAFASRAFPEIIKDKRIVQCTVPVTSEVNNLILNKEPESPEEAQQLQQLRNENEIVVNKLEDMADLISRHMSWQLLIEDDDWENDMERLLQVLPITGLVYKKTYYDENLKKPRSIMCLPDDIVVNDNILSIERAPRVTHVIYLYPHEIMEYIRQGLFCELNDAEKAELFVYQTNGNGYKCIDESKPIEFYEQHCRYDLDGDGYAEPYIITVSPKLNKVMRISARFLMTDIFRNEDEIVRVAATEYFTDFHFINSPDGKFHSIGYGILLYPQNETINTLINQLLDAGTLSNRQSGFIGRGIRMDKGDIKVTPGEWVKIPASTGQDIKNNIVPLPVREPSQVLLSLLQLIIKSGNDTANLSELLSGQAPTQNSPGITVLALLEQGMKIDSAIQKRIRRSLKKEFEKLFNINREYIDDGGIVFSDDNEFFTITRDIYLMPNIRISPVADPTMSSDAQRIARAQALMEIKDDPAVNKPEILRIYLKALQIPDVDKIIPKPEPDAEPPLGDQLIMAQIERERAHANYFNKHAEAAETRAQSGMLMAAGQTTMNASLSTKMKWDTVIALAQAILNYGVGPEQEAEQMLLDSKLNPQEIEADQAQVSSIMSLGADPLTSMPENMGNQQPQMPPMMPPEGTLAGQMTLTQGGM